MIKFITHFFIWVKMDIYIIAYSKGNRRITSTSAKSAWCNICPIDSDATITLIGNSKRKFKVEKCGVRIGHITCIPKGRI